jgi:hypothetical protein
MSLTCTVAAIIQLLGYMPPEGTVIQIPESQAGKYTYAQRVKAAACAAKHKIKWEIVKGE